MAAVAGLYHQCRADKEWVSEAQGAMGLESPTSARKRLQEAEEAKRKAKEDKRRSRLEEEEKRKKEKQNKNRPVRVAFNFETVR